MHVCVRSVCFLVFASVASGDPVSITVRSGAAAPRTDQTDVRMVSETLTVDLFDREARVEADILFRNEGPQQEVLIGFPQINYHQERDVQLADLKLVVDGEELPTDQLPADQQQDPPGIERGFDFASWHVAKVPFDADQERRIRITYGHGHGGSAAGIGLGWNWFPYLLETASMWKGDVECIDIVVKYREFVSSFEAIMPEGYQHDEAARTITWHLEQYAGDPGEIQLRWWHKPLTFLVNGEPAQFGKYFSGHLLPDRTLVLDIATAAEGLGYKWERTSDPFRWALGARDHCLEIRPPESEGTLDGQLFHLTTAPRGPYEDGRYHGAWSCMVSAADLERALGLRWTYDPESRQIDLRP